MITNYKNLTRASGHTDCINRIRPDESARFGFTKIIFTRSQTVSIHSESELLNYSKLLRYTTVKAKRSTKSETSFLRWQTNDPTVWRVLFFQAIILIFNKLLSNGHLYSSFYQNKLFKVLNDFSAAFLVIWYWFRIQLNDRCILGCPGHADRLVAWTKRATTDVQL
jgi:hypothetical protein